MSGKPAARLGDPTSCPKKGHGTSPITTGSPDVFIDGLPAARQGDATGCGSALADDIVSNVLINGQPVATLDSLGDHGNVVIGGSGTVIIGNSHSPAHFESPKPLGIAALPTAITPNTQNAPTALQQPGPNEARTWQEEPSDVAPPRLEEEEEEEELTTRQAITLRIGVFFDGTGNNQANAAVTQQCRRDDLQLLDERSLDEVVDYCQRHGFSGSADHGYFTQAPDNSYGNAPSNVARLFDLYRDDSFQTLDADAKEGTVKAYIEGIGTRSGGVDSSYSQASGGGDTGILARVRQSPKAIEEQLSLFLESNPDLRIDAVEFDIFGFSRGAAAARHFANELLKAEGGVLAELLRPGQFGLVDDFDSAVHTHINFIGLFDTVAAIVDPFNGSYSPADHLNPGVNLYLSPNCARKVLQLTARDEKRWNFALNSVGPDHQEIALPGAHSDIGGGYRPLALEQLVLSRPISSRVPADTSTEQTHAWRETWRQLGEWKALGLPGDGEMKAVMQRSRIPAFQDRGFKRPPEDLVTGMLTVERRVRGELSLIYLRIMRELAVQYGAPLRPIQDKDPALAIPAELHDIAEKLTVYARSGQYQLKEDNERLLRARYIHLSAHWTPRKGLMINKPAPNVRLAYNNKPQPGYPE